MKKLLLGFLLLCLPVMVLAESKIVGGFFSPSAPTLAPDGSLSALSYSFSSDINTGMYLKGADDLGFSTGGLLRLNINSSGNVGLGINSPSSLMHIKANAPGTVGNFPAGQLIIQDPDDNVNGNAVITGYESDGSGNPDQQLWYIGNTSGSNEDMGIINRRLGSLFFSTNNLERVRIDENGDVSFVNRMTVSSTNVTIPTQLNVDNLRLDDNTLSSVTGDLDLTTQTGGVFKFNDRAFQSGLDAIEYVEMGHGGGNGFINAVGDGGLDFRFEGATLATFTDFGHLHLLTDVDQKHTLKIKTALNTADTGIAWENSGGSFTHTIFRTDVGSNRADLIFAVGQNSNIDLLTNAIVIKGSVADNANVELVNFTQLGSGSPSVKFKKLTGTTGSTEGSTISIAHGLTLAKIIGFDALVTADNGNIIPMAFISVSEFEFYSFIDPTNVRITMSSTNSAQLLSNAVTVLLTYEE